MTPSANEATSPWPAMSIAQAHARLTSPGELFEMEEATIRGMKQRVWKNGPKTLAEVFLAGRAHGDRTFLVYEGERVSFEAFARASLTFAKALSAAGVVKGDRVAIVMRNYPEWPVVFFGAALAGAIVTPLNAWWTGAELEYGLSDSGAKVAIIDGERLDRLADHLPNCPELQTVYVARGDVGRVVGAVALEEVIGRSDHWGELPDLPMPAVVLAPEDDATIFYTSGTTGSPKGALGSHRNMTTNLLAAAFGGARAALRRGAGATSASAGGGQKAMLLAIPFFHGNGSHGHLLVALAIGAKLVLMRRWDTEAAMQLIERERVTSAGGVPTIAWQLVEHPNREAYDLSSLEAVGYGGAAAAPELVRKIKAVFPGAGAGTGWGMTETSCTFTSIGGEDYQRRPDSCGPAVPICDMKIVGPDDVELPVGEVGELWARGPNVVRGYWNKPQANAETFVDGWIRTGDLARVDEEGFCYIVDRAKDMLIRGGENIYCVEVENALYQHPAVVDAALLPIPHRTLGEEPGAVVHLKAGTQATEDELRSFVAERLAAFKVPVRVVFWPETLPRNANGKILKSELKAVFAGGTIPPVA